MSGYHDGLLGGANLEPADVLAGHPAFYVVAIEVRVLNDLNQRVFPDPIEPPKYPCDAAHVGVEGTKNRKCRRDIMAAAKWVPGLGPD